MADDLPEFPLFDVSDMEMAFGCDLSRYVGKGYDDGKSKGCALERALPFEADVAQNLFNVGGTLRDFGLRAREGFDEVKIVRAVKALLTSFGPSHQGKIGTIALALHHWCERVPTDEQPK